VASLKLVPTLSDDTDPFDPFEQAIRAGAGRSAPARPGGGQATHHVGQARPARAPRGRGGLRALPAPPSGDERRLPQQRGVAPRPARPAASRPGESPRDAAERDAAIRRSMRCHPAGRGLARPEGGPRSGDVPRPRRGPRSRDERSPGPVAARPSPEQGPGRQPAAPPPAGRPPLRLTRRGRALVRSVVLLGLLLAAVAFAVATRTDDVRPVSSRSMVVTEHDTLWTIAEEIAPDRARSVTMEEIRELNSMPDSTVRVGQRLLLPAPR